VAPSPGNCQPWKVVSHPDHLELHHDLPRSRTLLDPEGYAGAVAVGALLEGLHLAASARGYTLEVEQTGAFEGCMARVKLVQGGTVDPLAAYLGSRFTDRRRADRCVVSAEVLTGMGAEVTAPSRLDWLHDFDAIDGLGPHLGAVDRVRFLHPDLQVEMWNEVRWNEADALARPNGISVGEMDVGPGDLPILKLLARAEVAADLRRRGLGARLGNLVKEWLASASAVGLLSAPGTDPSTLLSAGRSMHRMWLAAHAHGFTLQPVGVVAYMIRHLGTPFDATYTPGELETLRAADRALTAQFPEVDRADRILLFRILRGAPRYAPTVRRPLAEVLIAG
jgi:GNAT superfamily N-acetyltransferase